MINQLSGDAAPFSNPALFRLNKLLVEGSDNPIIIDGIRQSMLEQGFLIPVIFTDHKLSNGLSYTTSTGDVMNVGPAITIGKNKAMPVFSSQQTVMDAQNNKYPCSGVMPVRSGYLWQLMESDDERFNATAAPNATTHEKKMEAERIKKQQPIRTIVIDPWTNHGNVAFSIDILKDPKNP